MLEKKKKGDIEWVKLSIDLTKKESWKSNWEQYKKKLEELLKGEFGELWEKVWEVSVEQSLRYVESVVMKNSPKGEWKKSLNEKERKEVEKKQEQIFKNITEERKNRRWMEEAERENTKTEQGHQRSTSVVSNSSATGEKKTPPPLTLKVKKDEDLTPEEIEATRLQSGEILKPPVIFSPQKVEEIEENFNDRTEGVGIVQNLLTENEELKNCLNFKEREIKKLILEKQVRELTDKINEYKELINQNLNVSQRLLKERIITSDSAYLENNEKMEGIIKEWQKEKEELENQLGILQENEQQLISKVEVFSQKK